MPDSITNLLDEVPFYYEQNWQLLESNWNRISGFRSIYVFLLSVTLFPAFSNWKFLNHEISHVKKNCTHKIPTRKKFGSIKYPREKKFGRTKYPRGHDETRPTGPTKFTKLSLNQITLIHCVKSVRIRSYSGPYFSAFGLNTD